MIRLLGKGLPLREWAARQNELTTKSAMNAPKIALVSHSTSIAALAVIAAILALRSPAIAQSQPAKSSAAYDLGATLPVPIHIVQPRVQLNFVGTRLEVAFWV